MADNADRPEAVTVSEEKVERLAQKLLRDSEDNHPHEDIDAARRAARRILEDSEARTAEAYELEPEDDNVIRRSSGETAATGDTHGTRFTAHE
ncbi:MAG: hypothetical protein ACRDKT_08420 [Actinomycetota bacterium]